MATLIVNGKTLNVDADPEHAAALGDPRRASA